MNSDVSESAPTIDSSAHKAQFWLLLGLLLLGILARFALLSVSIGSADAQIIEGLAAQVARVGLYETYRQAIYMNHPPLQEWLEVGVYHLSQATGFSFARLYKIPVILADAATCFVLLDIWRRRGGLIVGMAAGALYAWNLGAILVSGHHCNNDPAYSMLGLLALWLVELRNRPLLAGLTLGLAINVKLIPGLLLLPMLIFCRSRRELLWMLAGLAVMSLPYLYVWIDLGWRFQQKVLQYRPAPSNWGLYPFIDQLSNHPLLKNYFDTVADRYRRSGTLVVMGLAMWAMVSLRQRGERNRFRAAATAAAVYAAVAPALAPMHTVFVGVLLFGADVRAGAIWGLLSGAYCLSTYLFHWDGTFPITAGAEYGPAPTILFGMLAWAWVACYAWRACVHQPTASR